MFKRHAHNSQTARTVEEAARARGAAEERNQRLVQVVIPLFENIAQQSHRRGGRDEARPHRVAFA